MCSPLFIHRSQNPRNLVIEVPHAGTEVPASFSHHQNLVQTAEKRFDHTTREAALFLHHKLGGQLLIANLSRLVVDLNRGADRVDSRVCPSWPHSALHEDGGVISPHSREGDRWIPLYDQPLTESEVEERLTRYWYPYHEQLNRALEQTIETFGSVLLISLHSTTPHKEHTSPYQPTIHIGTQDGQTCNRLIQECLCFELEKNGVRVIHAGFYQGAFTTQAYGQNPAVQAIQLELDRRYLDPDIKTSSCWKYLSALVHSLETISLITPPSTKVSEYKLPSRGIFIDPLTGDIYPE